MYNDRLKELRESFGYSQARLAGLLNCTPCTIQNLERKTTKPSMDILCKYADLFNVSVDYLLDRTDETNVNPFEIKKYSYECYLSDKERNDQLGKWYRPVYPYNLLSVLIEEDWKKPLTEDQEAGLEKVLGELTERERTCLVYYYRDELTLDNIAYIYSVTKERIRQIVAKALRKLRNPKRFRYISKGLTSLELENELRKEEMKKRHLKALIKQNCKLEEEAKLKLGDFDTEKLDVLDMTLNDMNFSVRTYNCLKRDNISTLRDILDHSPEELMKVRNLGRKSLNEIIDYVHSLGFKLKGEE